MGLASLPMGAGVEERAFYPLGQESRAAEMDGIFLARQGLRIDS